MFGKSFGIAITIIFGVNLIFGLPVDKIETTTEIPIDSNSTNGTHKEFPKNHDIKAFTIQFDIPEMKNTNKSDDDLTLGELYEEEDEVANVTETEYDYFDGNVTTNSTTNAFDNSTETNNTKSEVYIIKAVTYEIGVLAEVSNDDNTTEDGPVTRQKVDLTFYDTKGNDSVIDFGTVPLPVQTTGVKGQVITGIAPVEIGALDNVGDILKSLPFTGTIVNITQQDTSYIHLNRENLTDSEVELEDDTDLAKLPILNNVLLPNSFNEAYDSVN